MKPQDRRRPLFIVAALALFALAVGLFVFSSGPEAWTVGLASLAAAAVIGQRDHALRETVQLPTGAATAYSDPIDLGNDTPHADPRGLELLVAAPALTTGKLPDTKTLTYTVQHDDDLAFGTAADLFASVIVQTGAGGAGAAAAEARVAVPTTAKRYARLKVTGVATVAPAVGDLAELQLLT